MYLHLFSNILLLFVITEIKLLVFLLQFYFYVKFYFRPRSKEEELWFFFLHISFTDLYFPRAITYFPIGTNVSLIMVMGDLPPIP